MLRLVLASAIVISGGLEAAAQTLRADPVRTMPVIETSIACSTPEDLTTAIRLSPDDAAVKAFLTRKIIAGACLFFERGDTIYVTETAPARAQFKIRKAGDYREFWVYRNALVQ